MNSLQIASALRVLANAFEAPEADAQPGTPAEPQKRGRGRQAKGEENGVALPAAGATTTAAVTAASTSAAAATQTVPAITDDPFDSAPAPVVSTATLDEVRAALKALANATTQADALKLLAAKGDGAANLTDLKADLYGAVVAAAAAALPPIKTVPVVEDDPFATPAAEPVKTVTLEEIKAAVVAAGKKTSQDTVQKVVMSFGGQASDGTGGPMKPSLKALPETSYAAVLAAINALPTTK